LKILASHDGGSGCAWYRMYVPLNAVNELAEGVSVTFRSGGAKLMRDAPPAVKLPDADDVDVVVSQRASAYEGLGLWRRWGSTPWRRTVYENDDDVFSITQENAAAYASYKEGTDVREATLRYISTANLVTTTSPHLGDRFREMLGNRVTVEVLPNYVPAWVLDLPRDPFERRLRIGWAGGASHARDIHTASPSVRRFLKRFPQWDLYLNGVDYRDKFRCPPERSFHIPWIHVTDDPEVYYRAIDFDIGICPLLSTQFSRSKSHIKALEYFSRGIPVVASDVEPYRRFIDHGVNGFLARTDHEWLRYLSELAGSTDLRTRMGEAAKAKARENTIEQHYSEWVNAYRMLFPVGWEYKG
jgi:glycosyltransferase involved in cell wall biosynthesis